MTKVKREEMLIEAHALQVRGADEMPDDDLGAAIAYARKTYPRVQRWSMYCYSCGIGRGGYTDRAEIMQLFDSHESKGCIVELTARTERIRQD